MRTVWKARPPIHTVPICPPADVPVDPPPALGLLDRDRLRRAAWNATQTLPEPVAAFLEVELRGWADLGLSFDPDGLMAKLVEHLIAAGSDGSAPGPPAA